MNSFKLSELCCLFCCPPCPGKIAAKLAFYPPEPTYSLDPPDVPHGTKTSLIFTERAEWQHTDKEKECLEVMTAKTSRGNTVVCLYVKCCPKAKYTILFSHANAVDLGLISSFYIGLGNRINCNIFSYDYSGYGCSSGKPSEKNMYADMDAAWQVLRSKYSISPERIILYGQSIGTVPTIDLASKQPDVAGVILHSPLMSGMRVAYPQYDKSHCFDVFRTIEKVPRIKAKTLVIHGTEDDVVNISHGFAIHDECKSGVQPLWVEGAGHNDVELYTEYLERLRRFISVEMEK
ncbi:unnamed protein product [Cyprideis torosa]|uniref:palmitoyl-protein hydrolase n=1 Tax=Cyprideis torosa TaxID=163714 RepID=A0A7R8W816_9CRUS|nr:unnamed protein product [Cyprideis torosa]CAG0882742.1 unnamed protein product [Cyprideis torosa]